METPSPETSATSPNLFPTPCACSLISVPLASKGEADLFFPSSRSYSYAYHDYTNFGFDEGGGYQATDEQKAKLKRSLISRGRSSS